MKKLMNRDNLSFIGLQWFLWSGFAVLFGFRVPYLKENGFDEGSIGSIMAILSLVGIAGPVFWGAVSDRMKSSRVLLAVNLAIGAVVTLLTPLVAGRFWPLLAVWVGTSLTICAMSTVVDAWAMRRKSMGFEINYGMIRGLGSLSYAVANVVCGALFTSYGLDIMFPIFCGFGLLAALMVFLVPNSNAPANRDMALQSTEDCSAQKPLHRNAAFLLFTLLTMVLYIGQSSSMNFYPLLLQQAGGTNTDLGIANGVMAVSEIPVMFLSALLLRKFKDTTLLFVSMAFFAVRILLFSALDSVEGLVWAQLSNSLSFGLFMPVSVHFIYRVTPERSKATAMSIASAAYMGVGGIVGNALGGYVIEAAGIRPMFLMAGVLVSATTVAFGLVLAFTRNKGIFDNAAC